MGSNRVGASQSRTEPNAPQWSCGTSNPHPPLPVILSLVARTRLSARVDTRYRRDFVTRSLPAL